MEGRPVSSRRAGFLAPLLRQAALGECMRPSSPEVVVITGASAGVNEGAIPAVNSIAVGGLLLGLVAIRGLLRQRFGGGWGSLVRAASGAACE